MITRLSITKGGEMSNRSLDLLNDAMKRRQETVEAARKQAEEERRLQELSKKYNVPIEDLRNR